MLPCEGSRRRWRSQQRIPAALRQLVASHERGGAGCGEAPGDAIALRRWRVQELEVARESATGVARKEDEHPRLASLVAEPTAHGRARQLPIGRQDREAGAES